MNGPKPRKLKSRTHKRFGTHSRILTQDILDREPWTRATGRKPGSKQVAPGEYGRRARSGLGTDSRTRAEKLNDAQREHDE